MVNFKKEVGPMQLKKLVCMVLACVSLFGCMTTGAGAIQVSENAEICSVQRASGKFNMSVPGNTILKANSTFPMEVGETVRINASYSPDGSVDFGLIDSKGIFHFVNVEKGSIDKTIRIDKRDTYTFAIRNNSSKEISVSGFVTY